MTHKEMCPKSFLPETVSVSSLLMFLPAEWREAVGRTRFRGLERYSFVALTTAPSRSSFAPLKTAVL